MKDKEKLTKKQEEEIERATDVLGIKEPAEAFQEQLVSVMDKLGIKRSPEYASKNAPESYSTRKPKVVMGQGGPDFGRPTPSGGGITDFEISEKKINPDEKIKIPEYKQRFGISDIPKGNASQQKSQEQLDAEENQRNIKEFEAYKGAEEPVHFGNPKELMKDGKFDADAVRALLNSGQLKEENVDSLVKDGYMDPNEAIKLQFKRQALERLRKQGK